MEPVRDPVEPGAPPLLEIRDLCVSYFTRAGEVPAVHNFSLNIGQGRYERAPEYTWTHSGAGSNLIYVDPANELVIVARWIQGGQFDDVVHLVLDAMGERAVRR